MSDRTQEIKNLRAVATACKNYTDKVAKDLQWQLGTYDLSVDTNTDVAHIKQLPSGTIQTTVAKVDGVGYKVNQLVANGNFESTSGWNLYGGTLSVSNNIGTFTIADSGQANRIEQTNLNITQNHKILMIYVVKPNKSTTFYIQSFGSSNQDIETFIATANTNNNRSVIFTSSYNNTGIRLYCNRNQDLSNDDTVQYSNINIFNLTADFGSGNEPSTVEACASAYLSRGINIYEYTPQQSSIKNNSFTGVKTLGVNLWSFNRFTINAESGVSYTINNDNSITITNSSSSSARITVNGVESGSYTLSFKANGTNGYFAIFNWSPITYAYTNGTNTIQISGYSTGAWSFYVDANSSITISNVMLNEGSTALPFIPYSSQTISVDLTTIKDSNNVSLFPSGKMMGNSSVADFITPYNQESRWNEVDLGTLAYVKVSNNRYVSGQISTVVKKTVDDNTKANIVSTYLNIDTASNVASNVNTYSIAINTNGNIVIYITADYYNNNTPEQLKTFLSDIKLQYERATYLTSNTDLTSLTRINAQSNGTITLNNTDNVDMPNTIKSLKEVAK